MLLVWPFLVFHFLVSKLVTDLVELRLLLLPVGRK
jgi:hypothetical protein